MIRKFAMVGVGALVFFIGCGLSRGGDLRSLMTDMYAINESYVAGLENAKGPQDVAATINQYCDKIDPLMPRIKAIKEKYPELNFANSNKYPAEISDFKEKNAAQAVRIRKASGKVAQHMLNPEVMKSFQRLASAMGKMR